MMNFPYETEIERFDLIARWAMSILSEFNVQQVCLEGYAMGAKGKVFGIAENTGILKHAMWKAGIQVFTPSPMTVKKYFTGKGNSNKIAMHETFVEKTGIVITEIFNQKADKSPTSDVVDSYAMLCYGIDNYFK